MKVMIEIEDDIYLQLHGAIKDITLPPVREAERIVTPLAYPNGVPDWVAEVMGNNIANIVRHQPSPKLKEIQDQAQALERQAKALMRPKVNVNQER